MNIALVSSKGGHLGQMKIIFNEEVIADNSITLITESFTEKGRVKNSFLEKHTSYYLKPDILKFNPFDYVKTFLAFVTIFEREEIDLVITNGAQISIPAVLAAKYCKIKTIFMDTVIRVKSPNWSARFCYIFSDRFLVQHEAMKEKYGKKTEYHGGIL
jgi:UDP-N-acetylglucosamine:LPS N-acetylglucosamine transferase